VTASRRLFHNLRSPRAWRHLRVRGLTTTLRAGAWAVLALRTLRRQIPTEGLDVRVVPAPALPATATSGIEVALCIRRATCLERSLIMQRWLMAHGSPHDVLVGVAGGTESIDAHAWIDRYDQDEEGGGYQVLTRVAPPA